MTLLISTNCYYLMLRKIIWNISKENKNHKKIKCHDQKWNESDVIDKMIYSAKEHILPPTDFERWNSSLIVLVTISWRQITKLVQFFASLRTSSCTFFSNLCSFLHHLRWAFLLLLLRDVNTRMKSSSVANSTAACLSKVVLTWSLSVLVFFAFFEPNSSMCTNRRNNSSSLRKSSSALSNF